MCERQHQRDTETKQTHVIPFDTFVALQESGRNHDGLQLHDVNSGLRPCHLLLGQQNTTDLSLTDGTSEKIVRELVSCRTDQTGSFVPLWRDASPIPSDAVWLGLPESGALSLLLARGGWFVGAFQQVKRGSREIVWKRRGWRNAMGIRMLGSIVCIRQRNANCSITSFLGIATLFYVIWCGGVFETWEMDIEVVNQG